MAADSKQEAYIQEARTASDSVDDAPSCNVSIHKVSAMPLDPRGDSALLVTSLGCCGRSKQSALLQVLDVVAGAITDDIYAYDCFQFQIASFLCAQF